MSADFSHSQLNALHTAQAVLAAVGLTSDSLSHLSTPSSLRATTPSTPPLAEPSLPATLPAPAIVAAQYEPTRSRCFTDAEILRGSNKVTRQSLVQRIVEHPLGTIVEYPETGEFPGHAVVHIFNVDADPARFVHPQLNFQYSLGNGHGGNQDVTCRLLKGKTGGSVLCKKLRTSCRGLKACPFGSFRPSTHWFTSRNELSRAALSTPLTPQDDAHNEVFMKTISFFCALIEKGCAFVSEAPSDEVPSDFDLTVDSRIDDGVCVLADDLHNPTRSRRHKKARICHGRLVLHHDEFNQPYIECSHRQPNSARSHLVLRNLQDFDIPYLSALLDDNHAHYRAIEEHAKALGIGPLVPCAFIASPCEQRQSCPHWHRGEDNKLLHGALYDFTHKCQTVYDIFVPNDMADCPQVLVVSCNPHSHPPPLPVKTPSPLIQLFRTLLLKLDWKLADATPRRIMLDSGFVHALREAIGWTDRHCDPSLSNVHPSFGNLDHVRRLIESVRAIHFPFGTGYQGAEDLERQQHNLPVDQRYLRCVESHDIPGEGEFRLVICMTSRMASYLVHGKRLSIDTSFKRVRGWQEFEVECWDNDHMRSVVVVRAFTTSQSSAAHFILFRRIFEIARQDTGLSTPFHHINGLGIETIVADAHRGQALGLGMLCVELCRYDTSYCRHEPARRMCDLGPYDHLRRFFRVCVVHFKRNIQALAHIVDKKVLAAMYSLAASEAHPNFSATLQTIRSGGPKARAWLKDKETAKFVLPGLYQPLSLIPPFIWKASPSTTNGNEQAHRNVNRDGIGLTLLAGIMRGYQCDMRTFSSIDVHLAHGINSRDAPSTHVFRANRSLSRKYLVQQHQWSKHGRGKSITIPTDAIDSTRMEALRGARHHIISTYSALEGALDPSRHSQPEPSIGFTPSRTEHSPPTYDPRQHYSTFSTLAGALQA